MHKFAYQSPDNFRPNDKFDIREAAVKPYMGITAFLRPKDPWIIIGFDGKSHVLSNRDGDTVKLSTPFDWSEATDKSRLVAAICSEESSIPGTPHYSFEDEDWYIRIEDNIFDPEDLISQLEKTADVQMPVEDFDDNPVEIGTRVREFSSEREGVVTDIQDAYVDGDSFNRPSLVYPIITVQFDDGEVQQFNTGPENEQNVANVEELVVIDSVVEGPERDSEQGLNDAERSEGLEAQDLRRRNQTSVTASPSIAPPDPYDDYAMQIEEAKEFARQNGLNADDPNVIFDILDQFSDINNPESLQNAPQQVDPNGPDIPFEGEERLTHKVQEKEDRKDEKLKKSPVCPECGSHTRGNRIAEFDAEGNAFFHCKSCGKKYKAEGVVNPKLTYQVDDKGEGNYAPGPDDPDKVGDCPSCGYSWDEHHKWQIGDRSCPECGHKFERKDKDQDAGAPGDSWKNDKRGGAYDDYTGFNQTPPQAYRGNPGNSNVTPPVAPLPTNELVPPDPAVAPPVPPTPPVAPPAQSIPPQAPANGTNPMPSNIPPQAPAAGMNPMPTEVPPAIQDLLKQKNPRLTSTEKVARKAFTPAEQKSLIDENIGSLARNHSKLNLEGTHYVFQDFDDDPELSLW